MKLHYVYFMQREDMCVKIGVSSNPAKRLRQLKTGCNNELKIIAKFPFHSRARAFEMERQMHERFAMYRQAGEWFNRGMFKEFMRKTLSNNNETNLLIQNIMVDVIDEENLLKGRYFAKNNKERAHQRELSVIETKVQNYINKHGIPRKSRRFDTEEAE